MCGRRIRIIIVKKKHRIAICHPTAVGVMHIVAMETAMRKNKKALK
jgi:hypothetical protein